MSKWQKNPLFRSRTKQGTKSNKANQTLYNSIYIKNDWNCKPDLEDLKYVSVGENKNPHQTGWNTPNSIHQMSYDAVNDNQIGFVTGYNNLIVIDIDGESIYEDITKVLPDTLISKSGNPAYYKKHFFYYYHNLTTKSIKDKNQKTIVDVLGLSDDNKHKCVVAPGAIHPSGNKYEIINDRRIHTLANEEYELIMEVLNKHDYSKPKPQPKKKTTNEDNIYDYIKSEIDMKSYLLSQGLKIGNNSKINCIFHKDNKTKSLQINKDYFYCFGCSKSGSVIDLIMYFENLDIKDVPNWFKDNYPKEFKKWEDKKINEGSITKMDETKQAGDNKNLKERILDFINDEPGWFTVAQLDNEIGTTQKEKNNRKTILNRLKKDGVIDSGNQRGVYRIVDKEINKMQFTTCKNEVSIPLPLGLNNYVKILPKNVILIAGSSNAGKTSFALNIIHDILNKQVVKMSDLVGENRSRWSKLSQTYAITDEHNDKSKKLDVLLNEQINGISEPIKVRLLNSEMGQEEWTQRCSEFKYGIDGFNYDNFDALERESNFQDVIDPYGINVIDYLEIHDKFWLVGDYIKRIQNKMKTGVVIICMQKKDGEDLPRGGGFAKELPRLVLSLENNFPYGGICKVIKNKIPANSKMKLNGHSIDYTIGAGANIKSISDWRYVSTSKERDEINSKYTAE